MKIAILGTKGIPNNYGGYEQFAEYFSVRMVERGHSVTVYNPHFHKYKEETFKGVKIERAYSPESILGGAANIIYDHLCLRDALRKDFDIIYEAGYHSAALSMKYYGMEKRVMPILVTNMDGLEYKRSKWNRTVQRIIEKLEAIAVNHSPYLISDNIGIQKYLREKFNVDSFYIPYGADPVDKFRPELLEKFQLKPFEYSLVVARVEPENNIEVVIKGHLASGVSFPLVVVGNTKTEFGKYLVATYGKGTHVRFVGGIYEKETLDAVRHFASLYFHGHSVGGTNPSLLEAMACECFIVAHENDFNATILGDAALYFASTNDVARITTEASELRKTNSQKFVQVNSEKIRSTFNWTKVTDEHEDLFKRLLAKTQKHGSI